MGQVSSALDPTDGEGAVTVPDGYTTPSFPSLYMPTIDSTRQQVGVFLYEAESIWKFTLYWTMLLIGALFFLCAMFASLSLLLSLTVFWPDQGPAGPNESNDPTKYLVYATGTPAQFANTNTNTNTNTDAHTSPSQAPSSFRRKAFRRRRKRPPLWPVFLLPVVALAVAGIIALITGTVVGFALAAIYSAGGFSMSTWIPFLWALIQVLVLIISSYSTLTSIL